VYVALGVADPTNAPGARDNGGAWVLGTELWLFGGIGLDGSGAFGRLGDLWRYDVTTGLGPSWARDDGSLWMFGGDFGFDAVGRVGELNDLWRFAAP